MEVIPAVMPKNSEELFTLADVVRPFAKVVQLDIMDGIFAEGTSFPLHETDFENLTLPYSDEIFWEVHLMTKDPHMLGERFIHAGAKRIVAHIEAFSSADDARTVFEAWHNKGVQVGISILLDTPISAIEDVFYDVEVVQVMGIAKIGAQGRAFDERALVRVRELRNRFDQGSIAVDGGVNEENAKALVDAGANRLCVGSAILKATDSKAAYEALITAAH
jgi:ribulose-phosphate 3-epimerase